MKKILLLILSLFFAFALFACNEEDNTVSYNTNVPTNGLSDSAYVTYAGKTLSEKEVYNLLRSNGFSTFVVELTRKILSTKNYTVNDQDVIDKINARCYGTDDAAEIAKLSAKEKADYELQFKDNLKLAGVDTDDIYAASVKEYFKVDVLEDMYAKEQLLSYMNAGEKRTVDGEEVDNEYYYDDEALEAKYEEYFNEENTFDAIIVPFYTLYDCQQAIKNNGGSIVNNLISSDDFKGLFTNIYKSIFGDAPKTAMTASDLEEYNSSLVSYVNGLDANDYTARPAEFGEYKFLVYKISEAKEYDYSTLSVEKKAEYHEKLVDELLTSTFIASELSSLLASDEVKIYDSLYDTLFSLSYEGHDRLLASEWSDAKNNIVAEYGSAQLTVKELYNTLVNSNGMAIVTGYLVNQALLKEIENGTITLTDSEIEEYTNEYNTQMKSFNAGELSDYPIEMGEDVFRTVYYGFASESDVLDAYKANLAWQKVFEDYDQTYFDALVKFGKQYADLYYSLKIKNVLIYVDTNMDGSLDDPDTFKETLSPEQQTAFDEAVVIIARKFVDEVHYLFDNEKVESLEDAVAYVAEQYEKSKALNTEKVNWSEYKKFNIAIKVESTTEYSCKTTNVYQAFLDGVKALYNKLAAEEKTGSNYVPTSDEITSIDFFSKTVYGYHLLTSFGTVSMDSAVCSYDSYENIAVFYNPELSTVSAKYDSKNNSLFTDTSTTKQIIITDKDGNETEYVYTYVETTTTEGEQEVTTTKTVDKDGNEVTNGWHITKSSASSTNYYYLYDANGVKIEVGTKIGADGNAATLSAKNENAYASEAQYRIYIAKSSKLQTTTKNFIGYFYSAVTTRYTDTSFQNVLLINKYLKGNLTWADANGDAELNKFLEIQMRVFDDYVDYSATAENKFAGWWEAFIK